MISFIVSAFNEEKFIKDTIYSINQAIGEVKEINEFEIVIVNDGSNDMTEYKVLELQKEFNNIIYLKNNINSGMGFSIRKAIDVVKHKKFMLVPGDNAFPIDSMVLGLKASFKCDMVMPYPTNTEERSKFRNIVSKIYSFIFFIFFGCSVNYINGTTIYPTKKIKGLALTSKRHGIVSEMATKLLYSEIKYCEIPVISRFPSRERKITIQNLIDVATSFIKLFLEIKIINRKSYTKNGAKRVDLNT